MRVLIVYMFRGLMVFQFAAVACNEVPSEKLSVMNTKDFPNLQFASTLDSALLSSHQVKLPNKSVVLFYFSPNCPFCRAEAREIVDKHERLSDITFLLLSQNPISDLRNFTKEFKLNDLQNVVVGQDYKGDFATYYNITAVPFIVIYSQNLKVKGQFTTRTSVDNILALIK